MRRRLAGGLCCWPLLAAAAGPWLPLKDVSLLVEPGSVLDFSTILPPRPPLTAPLMVNADGRFALRDAPARPVRFLMATLPFSVATGVFPSHMVSDLYIRQVRAHGYNMVRLDFVEDTLMQGRSGDFNFNPEQVERLQYLLAGLKKAGVYYMLNGLSSDNGGYGDVKERWTGRHNLKLRVYWDADAQAHWRRLMDRMLGAVNPYTGMSTLADPALAGLIMTNENGLAFLTRSGAPTPAPLRALFAAWLKKKYHTQAGLSAGWKGELKAGEGLDGAGVELAKAGAPSGARMADTQRFCIELERSTADWMAAHLRAAGFNGLLTSYNNWLSPAAHATRGQFDWVDLHNYFSEPSAFTSPGSVMRQDSMLAGAAAYVTELAAGRHAGKAYTVSEYGQVFWNSYRRESALAVPGYAALQGWDMVAQHGGDVMLSYAEPGGRKDRIIPFMVATDPIGRATETLAALLYLRGDVAPARRRIEIALDAGFVYDDSNLYSGIPADLARLALVSRIGLDLDGRRRPDQYDARLTPRDNMLRLGAASGQAAGAAPDLLDRADNLVRGLLPQAGKVGVVRDQRIDRRLDALRKGGVLDPANRSDAGAGVYQSDTGQLTLESRRKRMTVVTPNTEAVVFDEPERVALHRLTLEQADGPALLAVSSVDPRPLYDSRRLLVVLASDARNSGMRFADAAATTLVDIGGPPVLVEPRMVRFTLKNRHAAELKMYATNLRGMRTEPVALSVSGDSVGVVLDTAKLTQGPALYFEITADEL